MKYFIFLAICCSSFAQDFQISELKQAELCLVDETAVCQDNIIFLNQKTIGEKKFKKVISLMNELTIKPDLHSKTVLNEIYHSMKLNLVFPLDSIPLATIAPHLIMDSFGKNSWMKGHTHAEDSIIDQFVFENRNTQNLELTNGFNRNSNLSQINDICHYLEPKTGLGTRPGFKIECAGEKIKVKFKEVHSEPFISRIFWATGFFVDPVDYHPGLKIKYNRRIFNEFNMRKGVPVKMSIFNKTFTLFTLAPKKDPFEFMSAAYLKSGQKIKIHELKTLYDQEQDHEVDYILTKEVQVQGSKPKNRIEIGQWSFNEINHDQSKMIRATMALSAWLALYDIRRDNNRLVLEEDLEGHYKLKLMFNDVGSGLGKSKHRFSIFNTIETPQDFASVVSHKGKLKGIQVNEKNVAYENATDQDFKVGLNLINQITSGQIRDALKASGFKGPELEMMHEKLLSRRDQLNKDFP